MTLNLKIPDMNELKPRITVFGVGGAGGNAVNNMIRAGLNGVDFVVANTDAQALAASSADRRIQMGVRLTEGLGAGSRPGVGCAAAEEAHDEIKGHIEGTHMVFITAGMGGGTGTGAAPVIASVAREQGVLTVGVVTKPFDFEGKRRLHVAETGILELQKYVDTLLVIPNQNLFRVANERTTFAEAFSMADQVLYSGVACITDVIVKEGLINLDFADVRSVMREMGKAMMGTGQASGENRATEAAEAAISNPLLDNVSMAGARGLLISISGGSDLTLFEVDQAATRIREQVDIDAEIILGATFDDSLEGSMRVSVVATGIDVQGEDVRSEKALYPASRGSGVPAQPAAQSRLHQPPVGARPVSFHESPMQKLSSNGSLVGGSESVEARSVVQPAEPTRLSASGAEDAVGSIRCDKSEHYVPVHVSSSAPLMPSMEEFPLPVRNQLRAQGGESPDMGIDAYQRKSGFFQRLSGLGLRSRTQESYEDGSAHARTGLQSTCDADEHTVRAKRISGTEPLRQDDESLEIPAFLRRQSS